jgi:hypothetical protein
MSTGWITTDLKESVPDPNASMSTTSRKERSRCPHRERKIPDIVRFRPEDQRIASSFRRQCEDEKRRRVRRQMTLRLGEKVWDGAFYD